MWLAGASVVANADISLLPGVARVGGPVDRFDPQLFASNALVQHLENPRLSVDTSPYRQSPVLRGPRHLLVDIDGIKE
jgi:hypothetical protein